MKSRKGWLGLLTALTMLSIAGQSQIGVVPKTDTRLKEGSDPQFKVGDVWEYKTRSGEESSRLTILRIDTSAELGTIIHVAVDNLTWKDCQNNSVPEAIPHMPFARDALAESVTKRVASDQAPPDYQEGYKNWKEAYSKKHAGIYVIEVKGAVSVAEKTWRSGLGCE